METTVSEFAVALDIGSSRTRCLIAEIADDAIHVVGRGEEFSRGVRRGEVIDLAAAQYATKRAIAAAEQQAGVDVASLFLATGSRHVGFYNNRACIGITREDRTVNPKDMQNVLDSARRVPDRDDALVIGSLVCSFAVDDVRQVREPEGMHGTRLEAEVHVLTDARTTVENMAACVDRSKHHVEEYVFAPYAAGEAVLEDDEKKLGVALIDIGAGKLGIMLYRDSAPVFSSVIPLGGDHVTHDIAAGLDIGLADAMKLKEDHATVDLASVGHSIAFHRISKDDVLSIDPRRLHAIVDCRVREILDIVRRELLRAGVRPAGIRAVLTGGSSRLPGLDSLATTVLQCPVRVGRPKFDGGSGPMGPEMATVAGLLRVGMAVRSRQAPLPAGYGPAGKMFGWLRQLF